MTTVRHPREDIYYWKCDRPVPFYGIRGPVSVTPPADMLRMLTPILERRFAGEEVRLEAGHGQGNHITFSGRIGSRAVFVRIEDGPERDDYIEVESQVIAEVARCGVRVAEVIAADASRSEVPFAWQVLVRVPFADLNQHLKAGTLKWSDVAGEIGRNVARWQTVAPRGFGPFNPIELRETGKLVGFHPTYDRYFFSRLGRHLDFLAAHQFLPQARAAEITGELERHRALLRATSGVLVHKDLALWNILGEPGAVHAFIDWDDAISGDPLDDISLLACFHDGPVIGDVLAGYQEVRPLPVDYRERFWLHLLRNMITKAVIRVGAGYFDRSSGFFLVAAGTTGADLRTTTAARIDAAWRGLMENAEPNSL